MATFGSEITFIGSLGGLSAYRMRGVDRIIIRKKGGASKKKIKTAPEFDLTRRINSEFSGRSAGSRWIMQMLMPLKPLADYNIAGPLNALLRPVQLMDTASELGKRSVALTRHPHLLEGFSLNKKSGLESVIRTPLVCSLSRETLSARVEIPALIPGINFHAPPRHSMYSLVIALGVVPDLFHNELLGYRPSFDLEHHLGPVVAETQWFPVLKGSAPNVLEVAYKTRLPDEKFSVMLSAGIRYGVMSDMNTIQQVKYAGSAKVMMVR